MRYIRPRLYRESHLSYDELDLDIFTYQHIVGRFFDTEQAAMKYLHKVISDHGSEKQVDDFTVVKDSNKYRILPKATDIELRRHKASEFIHRYGVISSPSLTHITHPLYAYVDYKYIDELKKFGVEYVFKPIKELDLSGAVTRYIKKIGIKNVIITSDNIKIFEPSTITDELVNKYRNMVTDCLNDFNSRLGTTYYIKETNIGREIIFTLDRYRRDEEEFLAVVYMTSLKKPEMI